MASREQRLPAFFTSFRQQATRRWNALDPATRALPQYLWRAVVNFNAYGTPRAAALAYYAIFSIFPLSLLLAIAIGSILGDTLVQEQIGAALPLFLPPGTEQLLLENIKPEALELGRSAGLLGLAGLIWSGLGLFSNVTSSLDLIFRVSARRSIWRQRLVALVMAIILVLLVTASFVTSGVMGLASALIALYPSFWINAGAIFLPLGLNMVIFALLFHYVPARKVFWDAVWPAALFGAIGWELAKEAFRWYLANFPTFQFVYSTIATAIVLLLWAFLLASIFLFSAELCAQLNDWFLFQHEAEWEEIEAEEAPPQLPPETPPPQ
jgi:membrane protein